MKVYKPFSKVTLYAGACALVIFGVFVYYQNNRMVEKSFERISSDIDLLRQSIVENHTVALEVSRIIASDVETLKRANSDLFLSNEQIRKEAEKKITALQSQVTNTQSGLDLSAIIKDWRPFIAKVTCSWHSVTEGYTATGSVMKILNTRSRLEKCGKTLEVASCAFSSFTQAMLRKY
jgi:hypothetical protein